MQAFLVVVSAMSVQSHPETVVSTLMQTGVVQKVAVLVHGKLEQAQVAVVSGVSVHLFEPCVQDALWQVPGRQRALISDCVRPVYEQPPGTAQVSLVH